MEGVAAAWQRWVDSPVRDAVLAVVLTVVLVFGSYGEGHPNQLGDVAQFHNHPIPHPTAALALVAVACLALAWRRRYPVAVLAVSVAAVAVYSLLGYVNGASLIAPVLAVYAMAAQVSLRRAVVLAALTLAVLMTATGVNNPFGRYSDGAFVLIPGMVAAVAFAGIAVANRRAYAASVLERAEHDARRRVDEERLRIARELHDVVAHTMATINVQAGVAAHVLPTQPEAVAEALQAIKTASKEGLRELRAILNVLRQADDTDPVQPAPGLAQLDALVEGARRAGLPITLAVAGEPFPLPAAVDLAAYRIVQESLTNVIRHAGPADATVKLRYHADEIAIDVTDTGHGPSAGIGTGPGAVGGTAGHGQAGMRERAAAVGGTVQTGPRPGGGYHVTARLPVHGRLTSASAAPPAAPVEGTAR
ncbi:MAG TPA: sensor histidine kinase [Streptosporangiaceae bacterium]|jgi:signal transduction histidine kinase|nr:sensor histidine kinase [Streptosporangiaceae bacterium]